MFKLSEVARKIRIFLLQEKMTYKDLAQKLDVDPTHLHLICSGKRKTSEGLAHRIEQFTKGAVKIEDFIISEKRHRIVPRCATCGAKLKVTK